MVLLHNFTNAEQFLFHLTYSLSVPLLKVFPLTAFPVCQCFLPPVYILLNLTAALEMRLGFYMLLEPDRFVRGGLGCYRVFRAAQGALSRGAC